MPKINIPDELSLQLKSLRCQACDSYAVEPKLHYISSFIQEDGSLGGAWFVVADCMKCEHKTKRSAKMREWITLVAGCIIYFALGVLCHGWYVEKKPTICEYIGETKINE